MGWVRRTKIRATTDMQLHNIASATDQSEQHFTKIAEKFLPKGEGKCTLMVMFAQQQRLAYNLLPIKRILLFY